MFKYPNLEQLQDTYQCYRHCNATAEGLLGGARAGGSHVTAMSGSAGGTPTFRTCATPATRAGIKGPCLKCHLSWRQEGGEAAGTGAWAASNGASAGQAAEPGAASSPGTGGTGRSPASNPHNRPLVSDV